jgi:hypothetical protein
MNVTPADGWKPGRRGWPRLRGLSQRWVPAASKGGRQAGARVQEPSRRRGMLFVLRRSGGSPVSTASEGAGPFGPTARAWSLLEPREDGGGQPLANRGELVTRVGDAARRSALMGGSQGGGWCPGQSQVCRQARWQEQRYVHVAVGAAPTRLQPITAGLRAVFLAFPVIQGDAIDRVVQDRCKTAVRIGSL